VTGENKGSHRSSTRTRARVKACVSLKSAHVWLLFYGRGVHLWTRGALNMDSSAVRALEKGAAEAIRTSGAVTNKSCAEVSSGFASWLIRHRVGLVCSSFQAGQLLFFGADSGGHVMSSATKVAGLSAKPTATSRKVQGDAFAAPLRRSGVGR
jgi:hypothetical protein